jgi:endonuclease/exonuclease/phosphatase (EEP) superfamily protein YafD
VSGRPFTLATFNAHDQGIPPKADVVAIQERPSFATIRRTLPTHRVFYPDRSAQAIAYDPDRIRGAEHSIRRIYRGGRFHGHPNTTPNGYLTTLTGALDGGQRVAVINVHLVNNAFGPVKRGERALRLRLWWRGWNAVRQEARRLRQAGYLVWVVGDLNRRARWWRRLTRTLGKGYDQMRYPDGVDLMEASRPVARGSDHRPILARFRVRSPGRRLTT